MNWVGKLIEKEVSKTDSVLELGCGTVQTTFDTCPSYPKTKLKCREYLGVDGFKPYVDWLNNRSDMKAILWNLVNVPYPFSDKSVDVVLLVDIIEHMPTMEAAEALVSEADRIAVKKIIVFTPDRLLR